MFGARDTVIKDEGTKNILMAAMNDDGRPEGRTENKVHIWIFGSCSATIHKEK